MAVNFSGSLVATGSIISTTGFTGSLAGTASNASTASSADDFLVRGTLTAQTINVQTITSSIEFNTGSTRNGSLLSNTHQFTGSVGITGSLAINGVDYNSTSASFDTRITNTSSSLATLTTNNAIASASFDTRVNANSSSIVQLSGSYLTDSASFSTRVSNNSASIGAVSSSYLASSASFDTRINSTTSSVAQLSSSYLASSASFNTRINTISSSYATTGSNIFVGNQIITGSLLVSGSTTQIGNNTLTGNTILSGSLIVSGSQGLPTATIGFFGDVDVNGTLGLLPVNKNIDTSLSGSYIYVSGSTQDLYFTQNGGGYANTTRLRWLEGNLYTGLLNGGLITAATGSTTFNISSGSGIIVNLNASIANNPYPTVQYVNWGNITNQPLTYLTSSIQTFVGINSSGNVTQQTTAFNDGQYNTIITIGTVLHQNKSTVNASITYPNVAYGYKQRSYDFLKAFGPLKLSGLIINPSSSLGLTVSSGTAFAEGRNYQIDPNNPSYITDTGTTVSKIFRYYQSGSEFVQDTNNGAGYTTIDPSNYNPGASGSLTAVPGSGANKEWSIQRVFWYPNSATKGIVVYYGNSTYINEIDAAANLPYESFIEVENTKQNAIYLGALLLRNDADFTNSATYKILPGGLFRNVGGSGGGGTAVSTLLSSLGDVNISGPTNGQPLVYSTTAGKWINSNSLTASLHGNADTATSASYATTSSFATTAISASYFSGSVSNAVSSSYANTASYAVTASYVLGQSPTASHALTASSADNFLVRGTLTAQTINAQTVSSSIVYSSGSNIFGDATNDNHRFTGSVLISGSLITNTPITGSSITGSFTGSLSGIASQASTLLVTTSSVSQDYSLAFAPSGADGYVQFYTDGGKDVLYNPSTNILQARNIVALNSISGSLTGSLTGTASYATQAITASFVTTAQTASYVVTAQTASYVLNAISASRTISASRADSAATASYVLNAVSASYWSGSVTNAATASYVVTAQTASYVLNAVSASRAVSASQADSATTASSVNILVQDVTITGSLLATGTLTANGNLISANSSGDEGGEILLSKPQTNNTLTGSGVTIDVYQNRLRFFEQGGAARGAYIDISTLGAGASTNLLGTATSASIAQTASYVQNAQSASYVQTAQTASYVLNAQTASYVLNAISASFATLAQTANTASFVQNAQTSSYVLNAVSSSFAATSSFSNNFRATALSLGSTPINVTTGYGNYISYISYPVTGSTDSTDFWVRVINISDQPQRIKLFVEANADNTIARDEFEIVTSGYGMNNHILRKPTSFYNTSKIIGVLTTNPTAASQEVWINIAGVSTSGTVVFYSNVSLDSLANMQTSKTTTKPTKSSSGSELTINNNKRQKYTLQLSAGAEFNGEVNVSGSSIFSGSVVSTLGFTGSLLGTSSYATQALTASNANTASYVLNAVSASFAATTSFANNLTVAGTLTAQTINVQTITSSIEFNTGSTRNGSLLTNTHEFTGSVGITGSLDVKGNQRVTGSLNVLSGSVRIDASTPQLIIAASANNRTFTFDPANSSIDGSNSSLSFNRVSTTDVIIASGSGNGGRVGIRKTPTVPLDISGSTLITGSLTVTEGITGSLQGTATTASYVLNAVSSSFAATSSYSNDFTIGGTLTFDGTLTDYNTVASSIVGTNNIFTKATGSYTSAFIKYTVTSGSNARSGEVMTVWNGTSTQYVDNSTLDIGDTSPVVISTSIVTSQIQINADTSNSGWKIKAIGTFI